MKIIIIALLVAAAHAGPVKDEPKKNETLSIGESVGNNANATHHGAIRTKRDCGVADLDKIEAKINEALEKQIELLLGGHLHEAGNRTRRATSEAAATSKVNPDGTIKSSAAAKSSNDPAAPVTEPILTNGHQLPVLGGTKKLADDEGAPGAPGLDDGELPGATVGGPGPVETLPPPPPPPHQETPPPAPHPIAGTGNTVQKVASKANMNTGTAVASAIAKRSAVLQTVDTSGGKAVANAEAHKGADTNVQSVTANGTHVGIANALVDNKNASLVNHSGSEVVLQNVAATGEKAVATATNNKGSGSGIQEALALGDEISIASVVSSRAKRELVQIYSENLDIPEDEDDGSYKPETEDDQGKQEVILLRHRVTRSPCISTKMDENLRKLIKDTVAAAFSDLKKDMRL